MSPVSPVFGYLLLLGLAFFFGLAFEDYYGRDNQPRPGGVRTFPLLAFTGAILYQIDPAHLVPMTGGLVVLGAWLTAFYGTHLRSMDADGQPNVGLMVPVSNVLAYTLGPAALALPLWVPVGATAAAVLLLTHRTKLHSFARRLEIEELITAGKFLVLTGLVLPLLPDRPVTTFTAITPHQVWLAVIAVSTISYASYLLQRYAMPQKATVLLGLLGGLYSSTVATVVLARKAAEDLSELQRATIGIVLATAVMYLRLLIVVAVFNLPLAERLAPAMAGLSALGFALAGGLALLLGRRGGAPGTASAPRNPLDFTAALTFAAAFVAVTVLATWVRARFGVTGTYALAAVIGVSDIDPFVISLAQTPSREMIASVAVGAILAATASNNLLKAGYAIFLIRRKEAWPAPAALALLALAGVGIIAAGS